MPLYDYKCDSCGKVTEFRFTTFDGASVACPDCGSDNMEKLLSASYMIKMGTPSSCGTCLEPSSSCQDSGCPSGGSCAQMG